MTRLTSGYASFDGEGMDNVFIVYVPLGLNWLDSTAASDSECTFFAIVIVSVTKNKGTKKKVQEEENKELQKNFIRLHPEKELLGIKE